MKLDLGAGFKREDGYLRADCAGQPDVLCDGRALPFRDGSFDELRAHHVLEHIPREALISVMNECHRALHAGGILDVEVPIFPSEAAMGDPTHVSFFVARTFDYFVRGSKYEEHRELYGILPWALVARERLGNNDILRVRLQKCES